VILIFRIEIIGDATVEKIPLGSDFNTLRKDDGSDISFSIDSRHTGGWAPGDGVELSDYLHGEDEDELKKLVVGGFCQFLPNEDYKQPTWQCKTVYFSDVKLSEKQMKMLVDYTRGQWSDGWGEWFEQHASKTIRQYVLKGQKCYDCNQIRIENLLNDRILRDANGNLSNKNYSRNLR